MKYIRFIVYKVKEIINDYIRCGLKIKEISDNFLGCGLVANRTMGALSLVGIECRLAAVITKEQYDKKLDGHTVFEFKTDSGWFLYDAFLGVTVSREGKLLNLNEACKAIIEDDFQLNMVGTDKLPPKIFDMDTNNWIKRVYQVPLIYRDKKFHTYDYPTIDRNKRNGYSYLSYKDWNYVFYTSVSQSPNNGDKQG